MRKTVRIQFISAKKWSRSSTSGVPPCSRTALMNDGRTRQRMMLAVANLFLAVS